MNCYNNKCSWWDRNDPENGYCGYGIINTKGMCDNPIPSVAALKLKLFMEKHGLGEEDMINDITYPPIET